MNKKLKQTLKSHLRPHLPKTLEDLESLHNNKSWVIHTINNLLTEKFFLKILETRLLSELERKMSFEVTQDCSIEEILELLEPKPLLNILNGICSKPLFIPDPAKPKAPAKWLDLAKHLVEEKGLLDNFNLKYETWNLEQVAIKLRDLCKDNEEEIEKIVEELKGGES